MRDFATVLQIATDLQKLFSLCKCSLCSCIFTLCSHQSIEGLCHSDRQTSAGNFQFGPGGSFQRSRTTQILKLSSAQINRLMSVALTYIFMDRVISDENPTRHAIRLRIKKLCVVSKRWEQCGSRLNFILVC